MFLIAMLCAVFVIVAAMFLVDDHTMEVRGGSMETYELQLEDGDTAWLRWRSNGPLEYVAEVNGVVVDEHKGEFTSHVITAGDDTLVVATFENPQTEPVSVTVSVSYTFSTPGLIFQTIFWSMMYLLGIAAVIAFMSASPGGIRKSRKKPGEADELKGWRIPPWRRMLIYHLVLVGVIVWFIWHSINYLESLEFELIRFYYIIFSTVTLAISLALLAWMIVEHRWYQVGMAELYARRDFGEVVDTLRLGLERNGVDNRESGINIPLLLYRFRRHQFHLDNGKRLFVAGLSVAGSNHIRLGPMGGVMLRTR